MNKQRLFRYFVFFFSVGSLTACETPGPVAAPAPSPGPYPVWQKQLAPANYPASYNRDNSNHPDRTRELPATGSSQP